MKINVLYRKQDTYRIPDEKWQEAMALCGNDIEDAFDFLANESLEDFRLYEGACVRYFEAEEEK
jgi:hypothetical protein